MEKVLSTIIQNSQLKDKEKWENALIDLRLIIERYTQNRYEIGNYYLLFNEKKLIEFRLNEETLQYIKYFLFFMLFNYHDRSVLVAKCIKVLFNKDIRDGICAGIEFYMHKDDDTTCELIYAIIDVGDTQDYFSNKRIINLFKDLLKFGGPNSKELAKKEIKYYQEFFKT